ncbi:hypothetical protein AB0K52_22335 [Glycomyces sp. NPDC049804]|uniref:hypothetical protein n=1 Tax=Glycomyces sp. NPDC049804 TaxID=3154363 RepID=UPI003419C78F
MAISCAGADSRSAGSDSRRAVISSSPHSRIDCGVFETVRVELDAVEGFRAERVDQVDAQFGTVGLASQSSQERRLAGGGPAGDEAAPQATAGVDPPCDGGCERD